MSGIIKGIKKVVSKANRIRKKITSGVKKIFKKIASSAIGKIVLAAIVIYTGGVLMGAWGSAGPMSGMFGAWGGGAGAATTTAATTGATTGATTAAAGGVSGSSALSSVAASMPAAAQTAGAGLVAAETAAATTAGSGFLATAGNALNTGAAWMQANPMATAIGFKGLSAALSPDEEDMMKLQEESRLRRWSSLENLSGTNLGKITPSLTRLQDSTGQPWHERLKGGT